MLAEKDDNPLTGLKKAESLAKIFSLIALPLLVAVGGWYMQSSQNENMVKSQYVSMAISILAKDPEGSNFALREWAVRTIANHSSEKFNDSQIQALMTGKVEALPGEYGKDHYDALPSEEKVLFYLWQLEQLRQADQ